MSDDEQIELILDRWYEAFENNERPDVDVLCKDCPHLQLELEQRIAKIIGMQERFSVASTDPSHEDSLDLKYIGGLEVLEILGRGGMGVVYRCRQVDPPREVAVKVLPPLAASPRALQRFDVERAALARLQHPNIAQIYEAGTHATDAGSHPYFVMELVDRQQAGKTCSGSVTIAEHAEVERFSATRRIELIICLADAIEYAHQQHVVHRDLKPSNILVNAQGVLKVLDFGIARLTDDDSSRATAVSSSVPGTVSYMSPEQAVGKTDDVNERSDVYAIGVICFELLAGELPYSINGLSDFELRQTIANQMPQRLISYKDSLPEFSSLALSDLSLVVDGALEKSSVRRYQSPREFANDLRRVVNREAIGRRPPSSWYRIAMFTRRNRAIVTGVSAVMVALLVGLAVASSLAIQLRQRNVDLEARNAELSAGRGSWQASITSFDRAIRSAPERSDLRIRRIKSLIALQRMDEAADELMQLKRLGTVGPETAVLEFELAALKGKDMEVFLELLNSPTIDPAEKYYCMSLVEPQVERALMHLDAAVEQNPLHHRAQIRRLAMLYALGEAEQLTTFSQAATLAWPEDFAAQFFSSLARLMVGDESAARIAFGRVKESLGNDHVTQLEPEFERIAGYFRSFHGDEDTPAAYHLPDDALQEFADFMALTPSGDGEISLKNWYPMPSKQAWATIKAADQYLVRGEYHRAELLDWIEKLDQQLPATSNSPMHGFVAVLQADLAMQIRDVSEKITRAAPYFRKGANQPSLIPKLRLYSRMWAMKLSKWLSDNAEVRDAENLERAKIDLAAACDSFSLSRGDIEFLITAAIELQEYAQGRELLNELRLRIDASGGEERVLRLTMKLEFAAGHYVAAHRVAERLREVAPSDADAADIATRAERAMRSYLDQASEN